MVELDGELEFASGDARLRVLATGREIAVEIAGFSPLALALRRPRAAASALRRVGAVLVRLGLTLTVSRGRLRILELGPNVRTGLLARVLRVPHVSIFRKYGA